MSKPAETVKQRPAETGGVIGSLVVLGCAAFGVDDPAVIAFLGALAGAAPAAITWAVTTFRSPERG